jgi:hypothetical protein
LHPAHDRGEVDGDWTHVDPVSGCGAGGRGGMSARDQCFARHAAGPQAVTAGAFALDQDDTGAQAGRGFCGDDPCSSATDNGEVIWQPAHRVPLPSPVPFTTRAITSVALELPVVVGT